MEKIRDFPDWIGGISVKITVDECKHVAKLSRLYLSEEEMEKMTADMEGIIGFADQLNELSTEGVQPTAHAIPVQNVFREDVLLGSMDREKLLQNAPQRDEECYLVPRVVE